MSLLPHWQAQQRDVVSRERMVLLLLMEIDGGLIVARARHVWLEGWVPSLNPGPIHPHRCLALGRRQQPACA